MGLFKKKKKPEPAPEEKKSPLDEMDPSIRPGGVFMVQLLMKEKCEMPSLPPADDRGAHPPHRQGGGGGA